jgi:hypothetical protein
MNTIANAQFAGRPGAQPTLQQQSFARLQGSAKQIAQILAQNPRPSADIKENVSAQFAAMQKNVSAYCSNIAGTEAVLKAFNDASVEWQLLRAGH